MILRLGYGDEVPATPRRPLSQVRRPLRTPPERPAVAGPTGGGQRGHRAAVNRLPHLARGSGHRHRRRGENASARYHRKREADEDVVMPRRPGSHHPVNARPCQGIGHQLRHARNNDTHPVRDRGSISSISNASTPPSAAAASRVSGAVHITTASSSTANVTGTIAGNAATVNTTRPTCARVSNTRIRCARAAPGTTHHGSRAPLFASSGTTGRRNPGSRGSTDRRQPETVERPRALPRSPARACFRWRRPAQCNVARRTWRAPVA